MIVGRRTFLKGLIAAPIVVRSGLLMPVRSLVKPGCKACLGLRSCSGGLGICLCKIREQLLPGLRHIEGKYMPAYGAMFGLAPVKKEGSIIRFDAIA